MATKKTPAVTQEPSEEKAPVMETVPEEKKTQDELAELLRKQQAQIEALQKQQEENAMLRKQLAEAQAAQAAQFASRNMDDRETVQQAIRKCLEEGRDPWTVTVSIRSRLRKDTTEKHYWAGVNGRTMALPADDKYHDVKLPFAEALVNAMHAERFAEEYADKNIQVYDPITNPHPTV